MTLHHLNGLYSNQEAYRSERLIIVLLVMIKFSSFVYNTNSEQQLPDGITHMRRPIDPHICLLMAILTMY